MPRRTIRASTGQNIDGCASALPIARLREVEAVAVVEDYDCKLQSTLGFNETRPESPVWRAVQSP